MAIPTWMYVDMEYKSRKQGLTKLLPGLDSTNQLEHEHISTTGQNSRQNPPENTEELTRCRYRDIP